MKLGFVSISFILVGVLKDPRWSKAHSGGIWSVTFGPDFPPDLLRQRLLMCCVTRAGQETVGLKCRDIMEVRRAHMQAIKSVDEPKQDFQTSYARPILGKNKLVPVPC